MTKIIALIDGSEYSLSVCDHAAWAAARLNAAVEVLHVLGRRDVSSAPADLSGSINVDARETLLAELADLDEERARLSQKRGRILLDEAKARLKADGVTNVETKLRNGDLVATVQELEADADLVVLGKRGEAADFAPLHLGSNLERIVRSIRIPVLVASRELKPIERVLIAFDGGAPSMYAVAALADTRVLADIPCSLVTVAEENAAARERLEHAASRLRDAGYSVTTEVRSGATIEGITAAVDEHAADLLVMGAYGHSMIRSLFIGSTTTEMIRSSTVPVLLFR